MTNKVHVAAHVKVEADRIRNVVAETGEIFGEPVDMSIPDEVIYAAFYAGWLEGMKDYENVRDILNEIRKERDTK